MRRRWLQYVHPQKELHHWKERPDVPLMYNHNTMRTAACLTAAAALLIVESSYYTYVVAILLLQVALR